MDSEPDIAADAPFLHSYDVLQCTVTLSMLGTSAPFSRCNMVIHVGRRFVRYHHPHYSTPALRLDSNIQES